MGVQAKENLILEMKQLGQDAIDYAYQTGFASKLNPPKTDGTQSIVWQHKTGNLHDSFGSAVYVDGELRRDTICYVGGGVNHSFGGKTTDTYDGRSGRTVLKEYLNKIHPGRGKDSVVLVCVAAMYYVKFLEKGSYAWRTPSGGGSQWRIRVISAAADYVKKNKEAYASRVYTKMRIKFPKSKVVKGDIQPLIDSGYYE